MLTGSSSKAEVLSAAPRDLARPGGGLFIDGSSEVDTLLFDLDGTLVDINSRYFQLELTFMRRAIPRFARLIRPWRFRAAFWGGVRAMQANRTSATNWDVFVEAMSRGAQVSRAEVLRVLQETIDFDIPALEKYFSPIPGARETLLEAQALGFRTILATNPMWPRQGVEYRLAWGGLADIEFEFMTHSQNSSRTKPQRAYYENLLRDLGAAPERCVMIGNDLVKDTPALDVGVQTFILGPTRSVADNRASSYGQGSFEDFRQFLRKSREEPTNSVRVATHASAQKKVAEGPRQQKRDSETTMPKLICIAGPDGSGKTTQIARVASYFDQQAEKGGSKSRAVAVTIWDMLLDPSCRGRLPFDSPKTIDAYLSILEPTARAHFLYHCFHQAMALATKRKADVLLINSYWYKYYATEVAHGGDPELLRAIAAGFPEPDVTFYLRVEPKEAFARKDRLSGYESGFSKDRSEEDFVAFQVKSLAVLDALAEELSWVRLNGSDSMEALTEQMIGAVAEMAESGEEG